MEMPTRRSSVSRRTPRVRVFRISLSLSLYVYIYIYMCVYVICVYIYIYIYVARWARLRDDVRKEASQMIAHAIDREQKRPERAERVQKAPKRATSVNVRPPCLQKDLRKGSIDFPSEFCRRRSSTFTEVARLVPPGRGFGRTGPGPLQRCTRHGAHETCTFERARRNGNGLPLQACGDICTTVPL